MPRADVCTFEPELSTQHPLPWFLGQEYGRQQWCDQDFAENACRPAAWRGHNPGQKSQHPSGCSGHACGREQWWDQGFADSVHFTADPVVAQPDVIETGVNEDDEFLILASDGLWCSLSRAAAFEKTYAFPVFKVEMLRMEPENAGKSMLGVSLLAVGRLAHKPRTLARVSAWCRQVDGEPL